MRLLRSAPGSFEFIDVSDGAPPYAILSHTWSINNDEEATYDDVKNGSNKDLLKLRWCREQAAKDGYEYFWIDTCCINKRDDAEVAYAIRSMYRWYLQAAVCYVYLSDVSKTESRGWEDAFRRSRWFTRGWTLQELIASKDVRFFARDGYLGSKQELMPMLCEITGIDLGAEPPSHRVRLEWVARRETKRPEDTAYCMMGICGVVIDPRYGEGRENAWRRLEAEIIHRHGTIAMEKDHSTSTDVEERRQAWLDMLRFEAMESRRMTIKVAHAKTCKWVLSHPACATWLDPAVDERQFLWIKGKPGAGKSVMMKFLDQHVTKKLKGPNDVRVAFYFNARGKQLEKTFAGLYRSLLVQMLEAVPELRHCLDSNKDRPLAISNLQATLSRAMLQLQHRRLYCFIDALDECQEEDVERLIRFFEDVQNRATSTGIYVCFASRHYPIIEIPTRLHLVLEEVADHADDLRRYVQATMRSGTSQLEQVKDEIVAKANGVFLWAVLVVEILNKEITRGRVHTVLDRLREMPPGLNELFKNIIQRDNENIADFVLCLRWMLYAERPLTLPEWYFAMMAGVAPNHPQSLEWRRDVVTEDFMQLYLLDSSKGLAEVTKGADPTTQFIHESVRDFLGKDDGFRELSGEISEQLQGHAHQQLKHCCLKGLNFDLPEAFRGKCRKPLHLDSRERHPGPRSEYHLNRTQKEYKEERNLLLARWPFAEYATTYVLHHANRADIAVSQESFLASEFNLSSWYVLANAFQSENMNIYSPDVSICYILAEKNLENLIKYLQNPESPLLVEGSYHKTPLFAALASKNQNAMRALLRCLGATHADEIASEVAAKWTNRQVDGSKLTPRPWRWAVRNGYELLAKFLLSAVPVSELESPQSSPHALLLAIQGNCTPLVDHLISMHPPLRDMVGRLRSTRFFADDDRSPLMLAAELGCEASVELLLRRGASVHLGVDGLQPLHCACSTGHVGIAASLLRAGADANHATAPKGVSPLMVTNCTAVAKLLLTHGANIHDQDAYGLSALHWAARAGRLDMTEMLVAHGADLEVKDREGRTPLTMAFLHRRSDILDFLSQQGADIGSRNLGGYSPVMLSVRNP